MACGCGNVGCGGPPCPYAPRSVVFTMQTPQSYAASLARRLIKPADRIRDLNTRFGLRPYIARFVFTRWAGGAKGLGPESVVSVEPILPTPLMLDLAGVSQIVSAIGSDEVGGVMLTEVSGCYTEEQLQGFNNQTGDPTPADQGFYYEIEFLRADGVDGDRRRFVVGGVPEYDADNFLWRVRLARARPDRTRAGATR